MIQFKQMDTQEEWLWIWERTKPIMCSDTQGIVAVDGNGKIAGICILDSWTVDGCSVHFAIDNPMCIRRGFINEVCRHAFVANNRTKIFGLVPDHKDKVLALDLKLGFYEVARIPDALQDGVGYIVLRMDKKDCKWIPQEFKEEAA
jgi:hypothetical protein